VTLDYPLVLVIHDPIKENKHIVKIMDLVKHNKRTLLVVSTDMQKGPLSAMVYNAQKGILESCAVNVPYMAGKELDWLEDIAVVTGAKLLRDDGLAEGIADVKFEHFGSAAKIIISESTTQIIKGGGTEEEIEKHKEIILHRIDTEESKHFKKIMRDRLTRLNQLQATIYVGGATEAEQGEQRDIMVDSLNAARAALEFGILPGGGTAMYQASKLIPVYLDIDNFEENLGVQIFQEALQEGIKRIIGNSQGDDKVGFILEQIQEKGSYLYGYN
jgi:chaperonin GroEL